MKRGFTLIELLSVIVVLAVIAIIAVPTITGVVNKARLNALKDSAYGLIDATNLYYAQYGSNNYRFDIEGSNITSSDTDKLISFKGSVKEGVAIIKPNGKTIICLTDGKNSAYKNYNENKVSLISGKVCTVPSNTSIVYLDGVRTLEEYTNQELTDIIVELQNKIDDLESKLNGKASKDELNAVATIASNAQDKADSSASATNLESVATIANSAKTIAEEAKQSASTNATNIETIATIANDAKTVAQNAATKSNLESVSTIANQAKTLAEEAKQSASTNATNIETIATIANDAKTVAQNAATKSSLESVSTIANQAKTLAEAAATSSDLEALSTIVTNKQDKITGGASTILTSNLKANRALISNGSGKVAVSSVTSTELGYLSGVTSSIQTQINAKTTLDEVYPVGSIYMSVGSTNPGTLFGGTWAKIEGRFLLGSSSSYTLGSTGGAASVSYTPAGTVGNHTLTINEMPSHTHTLTTNGRFTIGNGNGSGISGIPSNTAGWGTIGDADWYVLSIDKTGGSQAHNHSFTGTAKSIATMPPYIVVNIWKRTA
ncbi:MAG: prepilin-type N-terminal cleavage/methylation domain-containing protein [Bacilli bacterium]|nr:prepilin-type N-terminal cleavage/methylation domain-containing protein [Bacilli bacterium]